MPARKKKRTALPGGAAVSARKKKPKRQALPGGAPLRAAPRGKSRRKAGPRSAPARAAAKAPKAKAPCKYGPRLANGRCPTKPKKAKQLQKDVQTILRPSASKSEKSQAVNRVADAAAAQVSRDVAANVKRQLRSSKVKENLKKAGAGAVQLLKSPAFVVPAALATGAALGSASVRRLAEDRVRKVEKSLIKQYPNGLPPDVRKVLLAQHLEQARKDLTIRPSQSGLR